MHPDLKCNECSLVRTKLLQLMHASNSWVYVGIDLLFLCFISCLAPFEIAKNITDIALTDLGPKVIFYHVYSLLLLIMFMLFFLWMMFILFTCSCFKLKYLLLLSTLVLCFFWAIDLGVDHCVIFWNHIKDLCMFFISFFFYFCFCFCKS